MSDETKKPDFEQLFYSLIGSIGLADHLGDVANYVDKALKLAGRPWPDHAENLSELSEWLGKEYGVKTLYGNDLT